MRVVLDTNVLLSAVASGASRTAFVLELWYKGRFMLLSCEAQLDEIRRVSRYPKLRDRLTPSRVGRLVSDLRDIATIVSDLPEVEVSRDPADNYLLALAEAGNADYLVSGDKADLLGLARHRATRIVSVRDFANAMNS